MKDEPTLRNGFGRLFWLMIAFGLACIVAGGVIGFWGPRLFPASRDHEAPRPSLASRPPPAK